MSQVDIQRWDEKWTEMAGKPFTPHPLLVKNEILLTGGTALDLACGLGQNSIWLAGRGYQVIGIDVSGVALNAALSKARNLKMPDRPVFIQMDLDHWSLPPNKFDLICVFRFLKRRLFPEIRTGLRSGGLLFYSTRHMGMLNRQPDADQEFLLRPDELITAFSDWEIVHYEEGRENAHIIARND
jgi:tellurite methyltransferase